MIANPNIAAGAATIASTAKKRRWLIIQNNSDTAMFLAFDGTSTVTAAAGANPGFRLDPGGVFTWDSGQKTRAPFSANIYAVHAAGIPKTLHVQEF